MSDTVSLIISTAETYGVDPNIALAVAIQESGINQAAIGSSGEIGIFQLMPATAAQLGVDPTILEQNILGGIMYLSQFMGEFGGDLQKVLAAYNCGPGCVSSAISRGGAGWLSLVPGSTQSYVSAVLANAATNPAGSSPAAPGTPSLDDYAAAVPVSTAGLSFAGLSMTTIAILVGLGVLFWVLQDN
jgi:soluble lytic murein transglycosylase-like protein